MKKTKLGHSGFMLIVTPSWLFTGIIILCTFFSMKAQNVKTISGIVTSEEGEGIPGVNVLIKGELKGTVTDFNGAYFLSAFANDVVVFSYVGYKTQEVIVGENDTINVVLEEDLAALDEVVVVGYGTQKKEEITSSIASVKAEDFNRGLVKDVGQMIQGKVAGLNVTNSSGDPASNTTFKLRGTSTLSGANSDPLILINGIPGNMNMVAPEDIESIDVLKDGSAAAIYGTRGTNGVIIITTKEAKGSNINTVEYNGYVTTSQISNQLDMFNASEFRSLYPQYDFGYDVDWMDEITRTPISHVHNLSFMGGTSKTNYIANLNYNTQQGVMLKSDNETFRGRIEITHKMFDDKVKVQFSILGRQNKYESTGSGGSFRTRAYWQAIRRNPTEPIYNDDGTWYEGLNKLDYENPLALLKESDGEVKTTEMRYNGNITYNPIEDLTLRATFSYTRENRNTGYSETLNHISNVRDGYPGWSSITGYTQMEKLAELTATYNKHLGKHNFSILGGYSYIGTDYEYYSMTNYGFQDDYFGGWHNIGTGSALTSGLASMNSSKSTTNLIGVFGRATYAYDNKYLLMASLRHEGASQLWGTENAWGTFPSVSLGWRITNEEFMQNQKIFDNLKFRVGYGVTGSQPSASFLGLAMLQYGDFAYVNGQWLRTVVPQSNPNPDLRWEEKKETNIGLDFSSLEGRLSGSIDIYERKIDGLLYQYNVPTPPYLYPTIMANGGTMKNKGLEVLLSAIPVVSDNFQWDTNITFSTNKSELESLNGSVFKSDYNYFDTGAVYYEGQWTTSHRVQVGESIGNFYGFKVVDVDEEGKWIYEDKDGSLINYDDFTHDPADKKIIGNGLPQFYTGWNNSLSYKNWDMSINMRGAFDFQIINDARMNYEGTKNGYGDNRLKSVNNLIFGKHILSDEVEPEFNSYYIEEGDYWKIDNVTLGYTFNLAENNHMNSLRVYSSVMNALTITGYDGIDPEVNTSGLTPGIDDREKYPTVRSFTLGVQVKF